MHSSWKGIIQIFHIYKITSARTDKAQVYNDVRIYPSFGGLRCFLEELMSKMSTKASERLNWGKGESHALYGKYFEQQMPAEGRIVVRTKTGKPSKLVEWGKAEKVGTPCYSTS